MWKVLALVTAIILGFSGTSIAAEKATPEARQKQMEELGRIRGRLVFKLEELRKQMNQQPTFQTRSTPISDTYTKTRNAVNIKLSAENSKAMKDQPTLDALALKLQNMDTALNKTQRAWQVFQYAINDQAETVNYLNTLMGLCTFDDYWNRSDMDVQLLVGVAAALEAKADVVKTKLTAAFTELTAAFDDAEPIVKE